MRLWNENRNDPGFNVLFSNRRCQFVSIVLAPKETFGGPRKLYASADQWLVVTAGVGHATVAGQHVELRPGSILCIEAGETHKIENSGDENLRTYSVYSSPVITV